MTIETTEVIVIGAGPAGLTIALELTRQGKAVRIFSDADGPTTESRAIGVLPSTLVCLEPSGAAQSMIEAGVRLKGMRVNSAGELWATVDMERAHHRFNFMLSLPQSKTEAILSQCLLALGVAVEYGWKAIEIIGLEDRAEAVLKSGNETKRVSAEWLVGADGAHSTVRKSLGIHFPGAEYPYQWSLADVELDSTAEADRGEMILNAHEPFVMRLPIGHGIHRIIANGPEVLKHIAENWHLGKVVWHCSYTVSHRLADRLGQGRIWLVGDAAHIHSPAGGRGMNLGIEDAATLAAQIVHGSLGNWASQRRAKAKQTIRESNTLQWLATADSALGRWVVPRFIGLLTSVPSLHHRLVHRLGAV